MFAVDRDGVEPDILTLAKSSAAAAWMPLGAMIARRDLWLKAYGSYQTFDLHSSTFSGGSLACAAGLATLRALRDGAVLAHAADRGIHLASCPRRLLVRARSSARYAATA